MERSGGRPLAVLGAAAALGLAGTAAAVPIPSPGGAPKFAGHAAHAHSVRTFRVPRHPFMAPNGRSNIHVDAYQTDAYRRSGPLGRGLRERTAALPGLCGSMTFDRRGRIVAVCVGADRPRLLLIHPRTLAVLARYDLPPRAPRPGGNIFQDFSGGGYFYLDQRDRAVVPTTDGRVFLVALRRGRFRRVRAYDLRSAVRPGDGIISALPDWSGRLWFVTRGGVVGTVDRRSGRLRARRLRGERIQNSFAVDESGGVYVVSTRALYRFDASRRGFPRRSWSASYRNSGIHKPGQVSAGSGTTPTLVGRRWVAITDNADPMDVVVYRRARRLRRGARRGICRRPVFARGRSATENSLVAVGRSLIVENNYGYTGPASVAGGRTTAPGIWRVDVRRGGRGCRTVWRNRSRAPSVVPKASTANGLVYAYTKRPGLPDAWYLTAISLRSGRTVYRRLAGVGSFAFNNNYAALYLGPSGRLYVPVLSGLVAFRDGR